MTYSESNMTLDFIIMVRLHSDFSNYICYISAPIYIHDAATLITQRHIHLGTRIWSDQWASENGVTV